jgi:alpha-D-xyloside xylohydrolase
MRGLFLDFPADPRVADIRNEYMFGPNLLVAPVTEQGATSRSVYLPAGADWYNFWTKERIRGGQRVDVAAPIDIIPLFVRAGSILPLGAEVESTNEVQRIDKIEIYPGADGRFDLYSDDGATYAYEQGQYNLSVLAWKDSEGRFSHTGSAAWSERNAPEIEIVGRTVHSEVKSGK